MWTTSEHVGVCHSVWIFLLCSRAVQESGSMLSSQGFDSNCLTPVKSWFTCYQSSFLRFSSPRLHCHPDWALEHRSRPSLHSVRWSEGLVKRKEENSIIAFILTYITIFSLQGSSGGSSWRSQPSSDQIWRWNQCKCVRLMCRSTTCKSQGKIRKVPVFYWCDLLAQWETIRRHNFHYHLSPLKSKYHWRFKIVCAYSNCLLHVVVYCRSVHVIGVCCKECDFGSGWDSVKKSERKCRQMSQFGWCCAVLCFNWTDQFSLLICCRPTGGPVPQNPNVRRGYAFVSVRRLCGVFVLIGFDTD